MYKNSRRFVNNLKFHFFLKKLTTDCLDLRENIIANFDLLEKLKLFQKHLGDPKYCHLLTQRDLDTTSKSKFDLIKRSFNYVDRELVNYEMVIEKSKKIQE